MSVTPPQSDSTAMYHVNTQYQVNILLDAADAAGPTRGACPCKPIDFSTRASAGRLADLTTDDGKQVSPARSVLLALWFRLLPVFPEKAPSHRSHPLIEIGHNNDPREGSSVTGPSPCLRRPGGAASSLRYARPSVLHDDSGRAAGRAKERHRWRASRQQSITYSQQVM